MHRNGWRTLLTPAVRRAVARAAGLPPSGLSPTAAGLIVEILRQVGGSPIHFRPYRPAERTALALRLLLEAVYSTKRSLAVGTDRPEFVLRRPKFAELSKTIVRTGAVSPRVWDASGRADALTNTLATLISEQPKGLAHRRLESALDTVCTLVVTNPPPQSGFDPVLQLEKPLKPTAHVTRAVAVLYGTDYYRHIRNLISKTTKSVDVCMFHIAFPNSLHPTARILSALVSAKRRGCKVRVLVDSDRSIDPYKSTVINRAAAEFLHEHGVAVRFDRPDKLLHSKFLLLDSGTAVIGSHNWSAGSYFSMDDLSLVLRSKSLVSAFRRRYDRLWNAGTPPDSA